MHAGRRSHVGGGAGPYSFARAVALGVANVPGSPTLKRIGTQFHEQVQELRYAAPTMHIAATREGGAATFGIRVHTNGRLSDQSCRGGSKFWRLLQEFSSVRVNETLSPKDADAARGQSGRAAKLELRDNTAIDSKELRVLLIGTPERPVFFDGPLTYEPTISVEWFKQLSGGCASLSSD